MKSKQLIMGSCFIIIISTTTSKLIKIIKSMFVIVSYKLDGQFRTLSKLTETCLQNGLYKLLTPLPG